MAMTRGASNHMRSRRRTASQRAPRDDARASTRRGMEAAYPKKASSAPHSPLPAQAPERSLPNPPPSRSRVTSKKGRGASPQHQSARQTRSTPPGHADEEAPVMSKSRSSAALVSTSLSALPVPTAGKSLAGVTSSCARPKVLFGSTRDGWPSSGERPESARLSRSPRDW